MEKVFSNPYVSPLRYPGGKRKLLPLIADLINRSGPVSLLVEPFAGGASVSIGLLEAGIVEHIALSDRDELIAGFWKTVFSKNSKALADKIVSTPVTLDTWRQLREETPKSSFEKAYKCLFLNRTSFSGILKETAGPIGGKKQESKYPIDCRFNREKIANRIIQLGDLQERVLFVKCQSYHRTIKQMHELLSNRSYAESNLLWYLDPPFFEKADSLYRYSFSKSSHLNFRKSINKLKGRFILSYDDVPKARDFYSDNPGFARVNLAYNARIDSKERLLSSEIIVSNIIANLRSEGDFTIPKMGEIISLYGLAPSEIISKTCMHF
ncbi:DNA adenine methylase [Salmonella enterica subsp. enterica serovar Ceyco]|uniref:DNA adenine methylase n=1 Tax=Salmonella enterica TaxID=28901 RepID=UPI001920BDA5|nr:DNA adenine methylase [Salmonella enterica subsp. salamae]MBL1252638.1 DNA adenine methylase [Salmonella enterica subsp. enterica serovar Ceyco]